MRINLILSETSRSFSITKMLLKNNIDINKVYFLSKKRNGKTLNFINNNILKRRIIKINSNDINSNKVRNLISKDKKNSNLFIYSGYPGQIIRNKVLLKKKFIHCHSGDLPKFKGT